MAYTTNPDGSISFQDPGNPVYGQMITIPAAQAQQMPASYWQSISMTPAEKMAQYQSLNTDASRVQYMDQAGNSDLSNTVRASQPGQANTFTNAYYNTPAAGSPDYNPTNNLAATAAQSAQQTANPTMASGAYTPAQSFGAGSITPQINGGNQQVVSPTTGQTIATGNNGAVNNQSAPQQLGPSINPASTGTPIDGGSNPYTVQGSPTGSATAGPTSSTTYQSVTPQSVNPNQNTVATNQALSGGSPQSTNTQNMSSAYGQQANQYKIDPMYYKGWQ